MNQVVKIYNFFNSYPFPIQTSDFTIKRLHNFENLKSQRYQKSPTEQFTLNFGHPINYSKQIKPTNEGRNIQTHILELNSKNTKPLFGYDLSEDITLLLTFLTAEGVYNERDAHYFSHKTLITRSFPANTTNLTNDLYNNFSFVINNIADLSTREKALLYDVLLRYREILQPISVYKTLTNLWEILDVFAEHKFSGGRVWEKFNKWANNFSYIIDQEVLQLHHNIDIMREVYKVRGERTHTSNLQSPKIVNNMSNLLSDLVYIVILDLLKIKPGSAKFSLRNIKGYFNYPDKTNNLYYTEKFEKYTRKNKESLYRLQERLNKLVNGIPFDEGDLNPITF